jgi:inner membrane protein
MAFVGCLSHPFFDWLNVYGIRLLEPFSSQWFYGDTLFIIDPWLWAVLIASIWWSRRREKAGAEWTRPARVGIAAVLAYIGVNAAVTHVAEGDGTLYAQLRGFAPGEGATIGSPMPINPFAREVLFGGDGRWFVRRAIGPDDTALEPIAEQLCKLPDFTEARRTNSQLDAFLFWSRAPFATRAADGSVVLRDARFTDPRVGDRFSLALPDVKCEPLP